MSGYPANMRPRNRSPVSYLVVAVKVATRSGMAASAASRAGCPGGKANTWLMMPSLPGTHGEPIRGSRLFRHSTSVSA